MRESFELFLEGNESVRCELLLQPQNTEYFKERLGNKGYDQLVKLAHNRATRAASEHLAAAKMTVIFVPGIMGSLLQARVGAGIWWLDAARTLGMINSLALDSSGNQVSDEKLHVQPCEIDYTYQGFTWAAYDQLGGEIHKYPFDWRFSISHSAKGLKDCIDKLWKQNGQKPVHLVAHSMGGLVVRAALMLYGKEIASKVGRIAFIATPHYGSPAIAFYVREHIRGTWAMWALGKYLTPASFRSLWGAMDLLPAPRGVYPGSRNGEAHPCLNFDCYSEAAWKLKMTSIEKSNFQNVLDHSRKFHEDLFASHKSLDSSLKRKMAMIIGVGEEMPFRVDVEPGWFSGTNTDTVLKREEGNPDRESDGSVPVASAKLEGLAETRYAVGEHAALPSIPAVYNDVFRFLRGEPMKLATTAEAALAGHLAAGDSPLSIVGAIDQSNPESDPHFDISCKWRIEEPAPETMLALDRTIRGGRLPEFNSVKIL